MSKKKLKDVFLEYDISIDNIPYCLRVVFENIIRNKGRSGIKDQDIKKLREWREIVNSKEYPFYPSRIILQDFTGVPLIVDLAALREKIKEMGGDPQEVNPRVPVSLVIDHSVEVFYWGEKNAFKKNMELEFRRNVERYRFLKWGQSAFENLKIVPPGMGIIHQVNMEFLAQVVIRDGEEEYPETIIGTDSHTTMINSVGVVGWGVGGIEAEAVMLGFPMYILIPEVICLYFTGKPRNATSTDIALYIAKLLRKEGVVDKFIEIGGDALKNLTVPDRATISNMSPEYGCTITYFPIDERLLEYMEISGRDKDQILFIERWAKENSLFYSGIDGIVYSKVIEVDLSKIGVTMSGPFRPHDSMEVANVPNSALEYLKKQNVDLAALSIKGQEFMEKHQENQSISSPYNDLTHGSVVIAAITSCTNTSNPYLLIGAGILARNLSKFGLQKKWYVKASIAPGSGVIEKILEKSGLLEYLESLGFYVVARGCTTCIGNSGPLAYEVEKKIKDENLVVAAVLSGNRNFEGRIHNLVKMNYLASPILVVAYAVAGNVLINIEKEPLGYFNGKPVYLKDVWPSSDEIMEVLAKYLTSQDYREFYANVYRGTELWQEIVIEPSNLYLWEENSTYLRKPPFWEDEYAFKWGEDIQNARCLLYLGDSITTDHISPAGSIPVNSPAGQYLISCNVPTSEFNSYGARRGNHEVMMRGTFANIRIKNKLLDGKEGGYTLLFPEEKVVSVYDAAMEYKKRRIPLIILAGKEYGSGSSRDWAAKGTFLLGVRAIIAETFERIHRSNLVQMGCLPLQFIDGASAQKLGLTGKEIFNIRGISEGLYPGKIISVSAISQNGKTITFPVKVLLNSTAEVSYYLNGGILRFILKEFLKKENKL